MHGKNIEVVIVEDDNDTAEMLAEMARVGGYRVYLYHGARTALTALQRFTPDVIVLDIMMPEISGLEALQRIRASDRLHGIPVILLSAKSTPLEIQEGLEAGANLYLTKPIRFDELSQAIEEVLTTTKS